MTTPKASWTTTSNMTSVAEDLSNLLLREKSNAQNCLRDCERLLQDPNFLKSDSLKEGLKELRSKTEDTYGTLLHLERVLNMKNLGDQAKTEQNNGTNSVTKTAPISAPASAPIVTKTGRFRQQRIRSVDFAGGVTAQGDFEDDPLNDELLFAANDRPEQHRPEEIDDFDDDSGKIWLLANLIFLYFIISEFRVKL